MYMLRGRMRDENGEICYVIGVLKVGTKKSSDTRKAERYFKERGIKFQFVDLK